MTSAALDRLMHLNTILNLSGDTYRLREKSYRLREKRAAAGKPPQSPAPPTAP